MKYGDAVDVISNTAWVGTEEQSSLVESAIAELRSRAPVPDYGSKKPEIFDDEYLERLVSKLWSDCVEKKCTDCPAHGSVEDDVCPSDLVMELWRRNYNLKARLGE